MPEPSPGRPESTTGTAPQPLRAATQGFVQLANWFTELCGRQATEVARAIDEERFDADAAAAALARGAVLPLLGWAGLVNEVLDAAAVLEHPPERVRGRSSDVFVGRDGWAEREIEIRGPLTNGFGDPLPESVTMRVEPSRLGPDLAFRLVATGIPPRCFGVYQGEAGPAGTPDSVRVWLVVP